MAINFPDTPTVGEIFSSGDKSWQWNGSYWAVQSSPTSTFSASDTEPDSPSVGDIWFKSDTAQTFIRYDSTWVEVGHSANIASYLADADADTKIQVEEGVDEDTIRFDTAGVERLRLTSDGHLLPSTTEVTDLGSASNRFRDLYLSGTSINLGGVEISSDGTNLSLPPVSGVSGDFTVDSGTLHVDATNNRVGVGTASPNSKIHVVGDSSTNPTHVFAQGYVANGAVDTRTGTIRNAFDANTDFGTYWTSFRGANGVSYKSLFGVRTGGADSDVLAIDSSGKVGIGTNSPSSTLEVDGLVTGDKFTSQNDIVLNNYTTLSPSSNVYLWSPPNDRDAWIYLDSAGSGAGSNWGIYHRQIDAPVGAAPANSIVFVGNTVATHYTELQFGNFYHAGYGASPNTMFMRYMSTPQAYEFGGAVASGSLSLTGLPTNTTYVLANAFITCAAADHLTMLLRGGGAPQDLRGWVGPGGVQPSTLFGNFGGSGSDMAIVGHPGDSDGYSSYYGLWAQVIIPMNQSRTLYYSFYGKNAPGTVAWGYIQVLAYAVAS